MKRVILAFIILICASVISGSCALAAIGVSPSIYEIDFEPGLQKSFKFNFFIDNPDMRLAIEKSGDFSDYLTFDKTTVESHESVTATLKLPETPAKYGMNYLYVAGRQEGKMGPGFGIVGVIRGVIRIIVPYPGKYAEAELFVNNTKKGELTNYELTIYNRGSENLQVDGAIKVNFPSGDEVGEIRLERFELLTRASKKITGALDTTNYSAGKYYAKVILEFEGLNTSEANAEFRVGDLFVEIVNYTREIERNKINRFEVQIESNWNDPIGGLYGEGEIVGGNIRFKTPSANLKSFEKTQLTGYLDATNMTEDMLKVKMDLVYAGKRTSKMLDVYFKKEPRDMKLIYITIASVVTILFLIVVIVFITLWAFRRNAESKHGKKRKKK